MARLSLVKNASSVNAPIDVEASKKLREKLLAQINDMKKRIRAEANRRTLAMMRADRASREIYDLDNSYREFENELFSELDEKLFDKLTELDYREARECASTVGDDSWKEAITLQYLAEVLSNSGKIYTALSVDERLQKLEEFAISNSGKGVAEFAKILLPELGPSQTAVAAQPMLPREAPEIYQGLRGPESPPEFVNRVYGPWLGKGLDRGHIRHLDQKLYAAIANWLSRPGNEWPVDVDLPTRSEHNTRLVASGEGGLREHLGHFTGAEAAREASRLARASQRRK